MKFGIILIIFLGYAGCQKHTTSMYTSSASETNKIKRYLALGDSYTIATGLKSGNGYPYQLKHRLLHEDSVEVDLKIIAKNGWTTTDLLDALDERILKDIVDVVSLLIGVNNQYQKLDFGIYATEFQVLLDSCISYVGGNTSKIVVLSIPDYGFTPFGRFNQQQITTELNRYNRFADSVCKERKITYLNITDISRRAMEDVSLLASDSLHPSAKQYSLWLDRHYSAISSKLDNP